MPPGAGDRGAAFEVIAETIRSTRPLTFERFMELALYHPQVGYYRRGARPPRDYITAPEISPLFGRLLGRFAARAADLIPGPAPLVILELGAAGGALAAAAVAAVELAPLVKAGRAQWVASDLSYLSTPPEHRGTFSPVAADALAPFRSLPRGLVVANELFDALPCRVVERRGGSWREIQVSLAEGRLVETTAPIDDPEMAGHLDTIKLPVPEGGRVEVCLRARELLRELARVVDRGMALLVDYGGWAPELLARATTGGTLRVFTGQTVLADPLAHPGSADITADVNFSDLVRWAQEAGWEVIACASQRDVLLALGLLEEVVLLARETDTPDRLKRYLAAKRFLLAEGLQERVRVLVLGKGLARPAREAGEFLGLLGPEDLR